MLAIQWCVKQIQSIQSTKGFRITRTCSQISQNMQSHLYKSPSSNLRYWKWSQRWSSQNSSSSKTNTKNESFPIEFKCPTSEIKLKCPHKKKWIKINSNTWIFHNNYKAMKLTLGTWNFTSLVGEEDKANTWGWEISSGSPQCTTWALEPPGQGLDLMFQTGVALGKRRCG